MPRIVDHELRKRQIVDATLEVIAESGTRGLSFRAVAARMGGSTTLVTHYFPNLQALLDEVASMSISDWQREFRELDAASDTPLGRLRNVVYWLVPLTAPGLVQERSRINLLSGEILGGTNRNAFRMWDESLRGVIRSHVEELVPAERVNATVELLRVFTNGVVLSVLENPDKWTSERQIAVVEELMSLLGLSSDEPAHLVRTSP